ncbi:preprotein translocase subunit SecG [Chloroflexia bacterium SDU3-3]|nr:preprotein translocase subunit SecG [Chloroflexia bacterium SDU3-3]
METALYIAIIIVAVVLIALVILQGRNAGLQSRDTSSIYRTKRGLEKTIYQTTVVLAVVFLILALFASLPLSIFTSAAAFGIPGLL